MAKVLQCDACGAMLPYKQAKFVSIYQYTAYGLKESTHKSFDVCPSCHAKMLEVLQPGGKQNG